MNDNEIFLGGDPRYLSGALANARCGSYESRPVTIGRDAGPLLTTRAAGFDNVSANGLKGAFRDFGIAVRHGRNGYHHRPPLNVFLREGEWPSAGVELETEERMGVDLEFMTRELESNWFHFEHDGSLSTGDREGYELITEPLPPRFYRNPRLWAGLQNVVSPWLESWQFEQTGLHVHVGLTQFEEAKELSFLHTLTDRRTFGKYMAAFAYLSLCDRSFADRIFLRKNGTYCGQAVFGIGSGIFAWKRGMTGADVADEVLAAALASSCEGLTSMYGQYMRMCRRSMERASESKDAKGAATRGEMGEDGTGRSSGWGSATLLGIDGKFSGHHVELNMGNPQTIEFRRGKGTVNGLSIHRMVEFTTLLVRYAMHMLKAPDEEVSPDRLYAYIVENTTSGALRTLAERQLKGE